MKKVLGLDLGSSSIGWALVHQPENTDEKYHIAGMGVRIIPLSKDDADEFSKGNAISKNANRTLKRGVRRSMHRYKMRKHFLTTLFNRLDIMPAKELFALSAIELYGLRANAVKEKITLDELARILFHLNQKRGYKSNRKANNDEEAEKVESNKDEQISEDETTKKPKKKGYLDLIKDRDEFVKEQTIGEYFYHELLKNPFYRIKENIFMRKSYENEFDKIWNTQSNYYPDILTERLRIEIRDQIIFYQRPLKSQKGLVSVCTFEGKEYYDKRNNNKLVFSGPKVAPKSSPLFQVSKIWQELNNVEITSFMVLKVKKTGKETITPKDFDKNGKRKLTLDEKQRLFKALNWGEKLTPKQILNELGYQSGYDEYKINLRNEKFMEGNRTLADFKKVFDKHKINRDDLLQFNLRIDETGRVIKETGEVTSRISGKEKEGNPVNTFENEPLYRLWHLVYSVEDTDSLINTLTNKFNLSIDAATALAKIDLQKAGYGNMSARALRNILPHLMQGLEYSAACKAAGYNHSNSIRSEENLKRELVDKLALYPKNSLRQPVVEKIVNQVINLINELIDEKNGFITKEERYAEDKFEIRIELARELKQSAGERNDTFLRNNQQDKRHKLIEEKLKEIGISRVSKNDIERYKLWEEFGMVSPYEPTKLISLSEVFNKVHGVLYDIEHIIPKSRLFDDSFSNKTICRRQLNSGIDGKNQMTAHDFMLHKGQQVFNDYVEFLKKQHYKKDGISKAKFKKLMMAATEIPTDFIDRQLNETRFISKEVKSLLQKVCRNVYSSTGTVTSKLRHLWGWDDVLMNLQIDKYRAHGLTEMVEFISNGQTHQVEKIKGWTKRDDHRHHAIDALSIACTKQGFIQRINSLNAEHTRNEMFNETKNSSYNVKLSLLEKYLVDQKPFNTAKVEKEASKILISFKAGKRVASKSVNYIKKNSSEAQRQITITPRGSLHEESIYGKIKQYTNEGHLIEEVVIKYRLGAGQGMLFNGNETIKVKENINKKTGENIRIEKNQIQVILDSIVDKGVRDRISNRLKEYEFNPKIAFKDLTNNPVWHNKEKNIPIISVRCKTGITKVRGLHLNKHGLYDDFVMPANNHHIAIYKDDEGKNKENVVTFWDAFERKKAGIPVIIKEPKTVWNKVLMDGVDNQVLLSKLPQDNWEFITSIQQNEMFIYGVEKSLIKMCIKDGDYEYLSNFLYRVQNIAPSQYFLRHHLETRDERDKTARSMKKLVQLSSISFDAVKVTINNLGIIKNIGEL
jgi:CRISPR-associated endonuclease Csn1